MRHIKIRSILAGLAVAGAMGATAAPQASAATMIGPDLKIVSYDAGKVVVKNIGYTKAGASTLAWSTWMPNGSQGGTHSVPALERGATYTVSISAFQHCSGTVVKVDSKNVVAENSETNNTFTAPCAY